MRTYVLAIAAAALAVYGAVAFFVSRTSASHIVSTIRIHREMADVFDFFTTPKNWPRWHPASISVAGATDHSLAIGEEVTEEFRTGNGKGERFGGSLPAKPFAFPVPRAEFLGDLFADCE